MDLGLDIIFIDDDYLIGELLKRSLRDSIFTARYFSNPQEAIVFLEKNHPRIIVVDYQMPTTDGLKVIERICALNINVHATLYIASSVHLPPDIEKAALLLGATQILKDQLLEKNFIQQLCEQEIPYSRAS